MKVLILFSISLLLAVCTINAQPIRECGTARVNEIAEQLAQSYAKGPKQQYTSPITIQVYFHILHCDDGTLPAATPQNIESEFNDLVSAYAADNICFVNAGFDRIYDTKLDTNFNVDVDASSLFDPYRVANCINIFYTRKIKGNNPSCPNGCGFGGVTLAIPNTFCLVATGNIGYRNTVAHEVGHCFGLLHTFANGNGFENIDGTNGTTSADKVQDTPADPYNYDTSCNKSGKSCVYSGTCKDPKGQTNFSPPYNNLMSYWSGACYPSPTLTTGQYTRAESFINTDAGLKACVAANSVIEGPITLNNMRRVISANNTLTTSGDVLIAGSSIVTYGGEAVVLKEGFYALPGNGGRVIIKPKQCN